MPNLADGFVIGPDSSLDPFFQIDAVIKVQDRPGRKNGSAVRQMATTGDMFSYRYSISSDASKQAPFFEYTNHSQGGTFVMRCLTWVNFTNSSGQPSGLDYDTVTFSGFGKWSLGDENELHTASVQISTAPKTPYVSILIGGGQVSNVNTTLNSVPPPLTALSATKQSEEVSP